MSRYDLLKAIGNVDEESVREAKEEKKKLNKAIWATVGSIAACLVLIIPIAMNMFGSNKEQGDAVPDGKPNMNSIYWLPTGNNSADNEDSDGAEQKKIDGLNVSDALYQAINETNNVNFGILVTATAGKDIIVTDKISLFTATGIYAEIVDNNLFIFPTKDEFLNMKLSKKQKEELYFSLVGKAVYTGENKIEVPPTDISE